tara:strand:- start:127 stop:462 length:336 start_codon:yes stop_codon:yes gene_type:complete
MENIKMENEITYFEYWKEVRELAKSIVDKEEYDEDTDEWEILMERVDSHNWTTYTYKCHQIMEHTNNVDAVSDLGMERSHEMYWTETVCLFAFWAFYEDISEAMSEILVDA